MQILDYAQERSRLPRRVIKITIVALILGALCITAFKAPGWYERYQASRIINAFRLIDSEVPGTEVYLRDKLIGTTPLIISKSEWIRLGLATSAPQPFDWDGWGEGLPVYDPSTNAYVRLMYKVPPERTAAYLTIETPWGLRTKINGGAILSNGMKSNFMSRGQNGVGVIAQIDFPGTPFKAGGVLKISATVTNNGTSALTGHRPEIELLWGTFDVQWQHRSHKKFPLPPEWSNITPTQTLQTTMEIPIPETTGDYSVFGTLNVFRNENDRTLVGLGSIYTDSKLLRVR